MAMKDGQASSPPSAFPLAVRRWSTDDVPPSKRLDYWLGVVWQGVEELEVRSATHTEFGASLASAECGQIVVNNIVGTPQDVRRTKRAIARSQDTSFYLRCLVDADWGGGQTAGVSRLLQGDCMLFSSTQPYEMHFADPGNLITLRLSVDWVGAWLTDPAANCGRRIDGTEGWGQALSSFVRQLTPEIAAAPPLPAKLMTDQLGALLALATGNYAVDDSEISGTVDAFVRKASDRLQLRYAEQGLTAQSIAEDLAISERTLHRHFARSGATFLQHLMKQRMAVAEGMLRDPRFDRLTVSEIGRRVGLSDASHFIRQCRATLGVTPAVLRRAR